MGQPTCSWKRSVVVYLNEEELRKCFSPADSDFFFIGNLQILVSESDLADFADSACRRSGSNPRVVMVHSMMGFPFLHQNHSVKSEPKINGWRMEI